ncbi:ATP synthase subunit f, mitochondrial [Sarcophilus harrisii]|uniref:ATP synthase F(0) complex subunit f, mitochondrial n=1 Tax=Sarcophilus harrisii TaxID=9305 RepID=A0A7N4V4J9_SARHA|nr:ATP synthase subunit f, mitochondrial [Sarcophilus harrisii]
MSSQTPLSVPLREQRLLDVKLQQVPAWIMKRDFSPSGMFKAVRRGYNAYFNKYIDVKKGGIGGVTMVLAGYILLNYCAAYKELKHERWRKYH